MFLTKIIALIYLIKIIALLAKVSQVVIKHKFICYFLLQSPLEIKTNAENGENV